MAGEPRSALGLREGEVVQSVRTKGKRWKVSALDIEWLPRMHDYLAAKARQGTTVTYGEMKNDLAMPHALNGLGRLLDLLSEACLDRRNEPSLAALVVNKTTGEVGTEFAGDATAERDAVFGHQWS